MDEQSQEERLAECRRQRLDECRGRQYVNKTFASYPSLRSIEPDEEGWYVSAPYMGQDYDPEKFWVCEDDWDHEHCHVCDASIGPGDAYWQSFEDCPLELCLACYQHLTASLA
jgi:hypothetical protein